MKDFTIPKIPDLKGANTKGIEFKEASLPKGVDLRGANLKGADLQYSPLKNCNDVKLR